MFTLYRVGSSGTVMISVAAMMMGVVEAKADRYHRRSGRTLPAYVSHGPRYYTPPMPVRYGPHATCRDHVPICSVPACATAYVAYDVPRVRCVKPVRYQRTRYYREYRRPYRHYRADRRHLYRVREQYRPHDRRHHGRRDSVGFRHGRRDSVEVRHVPRSRDRHHGGIRIRIGR